MDTSSTITDARRTALDLRARLSIREDPAVISALEQRAYRAGRSVSDEIREPFVGIFRSSRREGRGVHVVRQGRLRHRGRSVGEAV